MADYTALADAGRTLQYMFRACMTPDPIPQPELIGLASPADKGDLMLSIFLYEVTPNGMAQHNYMIDRGSSQQAPPLAVDLHYLVTAHSNAELATRAIDEQRILGRAIQVLHDNGTVRGSFLQGVLADNDEEFRIVMQEPLSLHTAITLFPNLPYKLSFSFLAGPIYIDSGRNKPITRIVERQDRVSEVE
ncbi:MAG: DUF4255 domain-containing protein [Tumebacillaceae bacterium]